MPRVSWTLGNHTANALLIALALFFLNACRVVEWSPVPQEVAEISSVAGRGANDSEL